MDMRRPTQHDDIQESPSPSASAQRKTKPITHPAAASRKRPVPVFTLAYLFSKTWTLLSTSFAFLFLMAVFASLPELLTTWFVTAGLPEQSLARLALEALAGIACLPFQAALLLGVFARLNDRQIVPLATVARGVSRLPNLIVLSLLFRLTLLLNPALLLVASLFIAVFFTSAIPCAVAERTGAIRSLIRSYELSRGHRLRILAAFTLLLAAALLLSIGVLFLEGIVTGKVDYKTMWVADLVLPIILTLSFTIMEGICYATLRAIKDGAKKDALTRVFE